ncbi:uncharacterized protein LOC122972517 isoform X2 [Thunnus albacares]|uniref:uncharacterized protein LOC121887765 isoform X4 n=1 Tax=Thunnus maccoyii TaxID=8240 RepID=UPI001C4D01D5|nr:uncharacterized protein LOC121887765 isoform X4 [Thunnus maccoyii]XP_044195623.1 uncharacterized protein LOC122972517 isoform X2 [Thunnus albacares]
MCAGCGQDGLFTSKQELIAQFWGLKTNTEKVGKTGTSDATRSLSSASNHLHHCHISWSQGCEVNQTSGPSTMFSKDVLGSKAQRLIERGLFFEPARVAIVPVGMDVYPYEEWKERCSSLLVQPARLRVVVWLARRQDVCRGLCHGVGPRRLAALRSVKAFSSVNVPLSQSSVPG